VGGVDVDDWDIVCEVGGVVRSVEAHGGSYSVYKKLEVGILPPGTHTVTCTVDGNHEVYERDEDNNTTSETYDL
jgi:hypothetical protein